MSKSTETILEMVKKHGGLYYMGKCSEFKGQYVILKSNNEMYLMTRTQKEMIEKLSQVI